MTDTADKLCLSQAGLDSWAARAKHPARAGTLPGARLAPPHWGVL